MKTVQAYEKMAILVLVILFVGGADFSAGQEVYPSKPVTIMPGFAAGGDNDVTLRIFAPVMEKIWGQPIIIVNKPGATGGVMLEYIKNCPPDGYNLGISGTGAVIGYHIKELPFHIFNDFTNICQMGSWLGGLFVSKESPWKTVKDLVEYGQKNPGKLRIGNSGHSSSTHMLSEEFAYENKIKMVPVSFAGDALVLNALLGNHIDAALQSFTPFASHSGKEGKLRMLTVFIEKRLKTFPDVPTAREAGIKPYVYRFGIHAVVGPKNLPKTVEEKISSTIKAASENPEVIRKIEDLLLSPRWIGGEEWIKFLKEEDRNQLEIMKRIGMKIIRGAYE